MALTKAQKEAFKKVTNEFQSAKDLGIPLSTLNSLLTKGYVSRRAPVGTHGNRPEQLFFKRIK